MQIALSQSARLYHGRMYYERMRCVFRALSLVGVLAVYGAALGQDAYNAGITLSPDEKTLAVGNCSETINLFQLADGKLIRSFRSPYALLAKPSFSPDGKLITAGNYGPDGGINPVWQIADGKLVAELALRAFVGDLGYQLGVAGFSPNGKRILGLVNSVERAPLMSFDRQTWRTEFVYLTANAELVAVNPKVELVAYLRGEYGVNFWSPTGRADELWQRWSCETPDNVRYMTFSGDGRVLVYAGDGWCAAHDPRQYPKTDILVDTSKGIDNTYRPKVSEKIDKFLVRSVGTSLDGKRAFLGARDGRIAEFDLVTGSVMRIWKAFDEPVKGLAITRDGKLLLSYNLDQVRVWEASSGKLLKTFDTSPAS